MLRTPSPFRLALAASLALAACSGDGDPGAGADDADTAADAADTAPGDADADTDTDADAGDVAPDDDGSDADSGVDADDADDPDTVAFLYDPLDGNVVMLPDDALTVADASTATGLVIRLDESIAWYATQSGLPRDGLDALDGLDGWGINAAIALVFEAPIGEVPSGFPASVESPSLRLLELGPDGAVAVPYEIRVTPDGSLLMLPMVPLRPGTRHGVVGTRDLRAADGRALDPGPVLRALLSGTATGRLEPMNARIAELLDAAVLDAEEVAFALAFTTQSALGMSLAVAADIRTRDYVWDGERSCAAEGASTRCEGAFVAWSWRDENGDLGDGSPVRQYTLPVSVWLPPGPGPHPTALFGHGLVHGREVAGAMASICTPLGIAVVAIDAVTHGEHPDAPDSEAMVLFDFFALSLDPLSHLPGRLRDNFRQSTWDKLQLLRLLDQHPDVDGDGEADLDLERMVYVGESFGGIMGIELLALTDRFDAAALQLGGGRVTSIISDARRFEIFTQIAGGGQDPSDVQRFFPVIQTAVDAGDASTWAPYVLRERLEEVGGAPPHVMLQLVIDDDTIPDVSSDSLVRALGLPHVPPVARPVPMTVTTGVAPVAGNAAEGARTEGFFQFDRVRRDPGSAVEAATHDHMPASEEGEHQVREFLRAWVAGELPPIVDPFAALETPPRGTR